MCRSKKEEKVEPIYDTELNDAHVEEDEEWSLRWERNIQEFLS